MNNVPTLQEELNRKSFDTLQKMHHDLALGKITKQQYKYGVDIAWSIVAGLVEQDQIAMFGLMGDEVREVSFSEKFIYRNPKNAAVAVILDSKTGVIFFKLILNDAEPTVKLYDFRSEPNPYLAAKNKLKEVVNSIASRGFLLL